LGFVVVIVQSSLPEIVTEYCVHDLYVFAERSPVSYDIRSGRRQHAFAKFTFVVALYIHFPFIANAAHYAPGTERAEYGGSLSFPCLLKKGSVS